MIDPKIYEERNFHGVKGLVFIDEKILVYRRDNKTKSFPLCIDLPGGGKENNETPFATFKRELKEEFNLKLAESDVVYAKQYLSAMDESKESYFIVTKNLSAQKTDIALGNEGLEYYLMSVDEYLKLNDAIGRQQTKVEQYLLDILKNN